MVRTLSKICEDLNPFTVNSPKDSRLTLSVSSFPERNKISKWLSHLPDVFPTVGQLRAT